MIIGGAIVGILSAWTGIGSTAAAAIFGVSVVTLTTEDELGKVIE